MSFLFVTIYFYAGWERVSNENSNGLLREFFPKKTDLAKVTLDKLTEALVLINNRPRKCLGFNFLGKTLEVNHYYFH